ncbi:hypothetical protein GW17_00057040 [Ensete ventricosum]|nr:hypothetical protein GW17_00057040 [Ensete ventricosum]
MRRLSLVCKVADCVACVAHGGATRNCHLPLVADPLAHDHYCMSWPLDATSTTHGCGQPLVVYSRASVARCDCLCKRLSAQPGPLAAWLPLLLCAHTLFSAMVPQADPAVHNEIAAFAQRSSKIDHNLDYSQANDRTEHIGIQIDKIFRSLKLS